MLTGLLYLAASRAAVRLMRYLSGVTAGGSLPLLLLCFTNCALHSETDKSRFPFIPISVAGGDPIAAGGAHWLFHTDCSGSFPTRVCWCGCAATATGPLDPRAMGLAQLLGLKISLGAASGSG